MKEIYPINEEGFVIWESPRYRFESDEYEPLDNEIDVPIPKDVNFIQPRWDGKEWVEGGSLEDLPQPEVSAEKPLQEQVEELQGQVEMLIECILEMADILYA